MNNLTKRHKIVAQRVLDGMLSLENDFNKTVDNLGLGADAVNDWEMNWAFNVFENNLKKYINGDPGAIGPAFDQNLKREILKMVTKIGEHEPEFFDKADKYIKNPVGGVAAIRRNNLLFCWDGF
jgi:hypothetical protein